MHLARRGNGMRYAQCHPDKKHRGHGMCGTCYQRWLRAECGYKDREKRYRDRDKNNARAAKYRAANPEKFLARTQAWRENNREHIRQYARDYRKAHPARNVANSHKWRARCADGVSPGVTSEQWQLKLKQFANRCAYCFVAGVKLTRDHVRPVSKGGSDSFDNVVPACSKCNSTKKDRLLGVGPGCWWPPGWSQNV